MTKKYEQIYDFYYSAKHEEHLQNLGFIIVENRPLINTINGHIYTETIRKGKKPVTNHFGDLVKIFTGTLDSYKSIGRY
ncbi:MAG: hypothetical protein PF487_14615 [Bacteroidales bacterium]|jgi:hypothetical protein|nr:hypothetical protein [Bacteroidales bacterium]